MVRCPATCFVTCRIFASSVTVVLIIIHFHTSEIICRTILCTALDIDTIDGTFFHVHFAHTLCISTYWLGYGVGRDAFVITKACACKFTILFIYFYLICILYYSIITLQGIGLRNVQATKRNPYITYLPREKWSLMQNKIINVNFIL